MAENDLDRLAIEKGAKEKKGRRKGSKLPVILGAGAVLVLLLIAWAMLSKGVPVHTAAVSRVFPSQLLAKLSASGYVVAQRKADVATKITGQLVEISVQEGSIVRQGQIMARIENDDARSIVDRSRADVKLAIAREQEAKANMNNARTNYERMKRLVSTGAVSRVEFDNAKTSYLAAEATYEAAKAAVRSSQATLKNAEVSFSYTEIRAPFDAVVLTKNADVGDIITPIGSAANAKAAVVSIADLSSLQVEADVSEANIGMVFVGQPCDISLDALPGLRFQGVVDTIVPTVDRTKATVLVKVRFLRRDPRILPEMSAKVSFLSRPLSPEEYKPRIMVNSATITGGKGTQKVFLVSGNKVEEREVKTGRRIGDMVEVTSGVKEGDTVVLSLPEKLKDGSKVTILEK